MKRNFIMSAVVLLLAIVSCKKDDGPDVEVVPPRDLGEVTVENDTDIQAFLKTHFYNYEEFASPPTDFDYKIKIDTLAGVNSDKTPLIDQVQSDTLTVNPKDFGLDDGADVLQKYYYLIARQGGGESPTVADSTYLKYEGDLLNGTSFDSSFSYTWQYLPFFLRGYSNAIAKFNAGSTIVVNDDGTTSISDSGIGFVILPSGLGYFNGTGTGVIPQYSNLLFKLDVGLTVKDTDYDNDGIPSIMEDLNHDGILSNDNTDLETEMKVNITQRVLIPNHLDADDDGDGTPTREEISDDNGNIIFPYPDSDNDGIPDYLDKDTK